jgi:hypothetical protein
MKYVWGEYPTFNTLFFNTMFYLRLGFWLLLGQAFLSHYNTPQWYRKSCHVTYTLVALMLCFSWLDYVAISHGMMLFGITLIPLIQVLAIQKTPNIENMHRRVLMGGFVVGGLLIWGTLLITIFPVGDPVLSIYLVRLVDYVNPIVLLLLVFSDYRQIVSQHATTKKENDEIRLRLEFEQKIRLLQLVTLLFSFLKSFTCERSFTLQRCNWIDTNVLYDFYIKLYYYLIRLFEARLCWAGLKIKSARICCA